MARMLKRWESPRREGRNHKGKGGTARQRQLKKQTQMLRKKLQEDTQPEGNKGGNVQFSPFIRFKLEAPACISSQEAPL